MKISVSYDQNKFSIVFINKKGDEVDDTAHFHTYKYVIKNGFFSQDIGVELVILCVFFKKGYFCKGSFNYNSSYER